MDSSVTTMKSTILLVAISLAIAAAEDTCPEETSPVCGSNSNTYLNECTLNLIAPHAPGLTLAHQGKCDPCKCHDVRYPICASNGKTYKNPCEMICEDSSLTVDHTGVCKCQCSMTYGPVCGSDGKTYGSKCEFDCLAKFLGISIVNDGNC